MRRILHSKKEEISRYHLLVKRKILGSHQWLHVFNFVNAEHIPCDNSEVIVQIFIVYGRREKGFFILKEANDSFAPLYCSLPCDNL